MTPRKDAQVFTMPNALTAVRLAVILPIIGLLLRGDVIMGTILAGLGFITDYLDGRIARARGSETLLGAIMDPVADKLIVMACMGYFVFSGELVREYFWLSCLRDVSQLMAIPVLMFWKKISFKVKPKAIPKWGTTLKFSILGVLFFGLVFNINLSLLLTPMIIVSSAFEVTIFITFIKRFREILQRKHDTFE